MGLNTHFTIYKLCGHVVPIILTSTNMTNSAVSIAKQKSLHVASILEHLITQDHTERFLKIIIYIN